MKPIWISIVLCSVLAGCDDRTDTPAPEATHRPGTYETRNGPENGSLGEPPPVTRVSHISAAGESSRVPSSGGAPSDQSVSTGPTGHHDQADPTAPSRTDPTPAEPQPPQ